MMFNVFSRLSKYLSLGVAVAILMTTIVSRAQDPQVCLSEMTRLRIKAEKAQIAQKPLLPLPAQHTTSLILNKPTSFDEINDMVNYYLRNEDEYAQARDDLQKNMLLGRYDLKQFVALQLVANPTMRRNWSRQLMSDDELKQNITGLQEKVGIKLIQGKKSLGQRSIPFTKLRLEQIKIPRTDFRPFGLWAPRAYAGRSWNKLIGFILGHYKITVPPMLDGTEDPDLAYAKLSTSFADALEKANAGSGDVSGYFEIKSFFEALGTGAMAGKDIFQKVLIKSLQGFGVVNEENIHVWLNISARLYAKDATRKKMLLAMIKNMNNADYFATISAELSDNELYILHKQGAQALIKQLVQIRGIQESTRFLNLVAGLASIATPLYFLLEKALFAPTLGNRGSKGVCDDNGKEIDDSILNDPQPKPLDPNHPDGEKRMGARVTYPFDEAFVTPNESGANPCDPNGVVKKEYNDLIKGTQDTRQKNQLKAEWYKRNDLSDYDGEPAGKGFDEYGNPSNNGLNKVELLMEEIRRNYVNSGNSETGCCVYIKKYLKQNTN